MISFNVFKAWASFSWIFCVCIWTNVDVKQKQTKNTIKTILLWYTSLRCWSHFLHSAKSDEYNHCFGLFFSDVNFVPRIFKGNWFCVIKTQRKGKKQTSMVYLKCDHIFLWKLISFFFLFLFSQFKSDLFHYWFFKSQLSSWKFNWQFSIIYQLSSNFLFSNRKKVSILYFILPQCYIKKEKM